MLQPHVGNGSDAYAIFSENASTSRNVIKRCGSTYALFSCGCKENEEVAGDRKDGTYPAVLSRFLLH